MKNTHHILKKPTLFSIMGIIILIIGLPIGIYALTLKGGASLGGVLIIFGLIIVTVIVIIDRLVVNKINLKKLNIAELFLLIVGITLFAFTEREIIIDLTKKKTNYFVLIENDGTMINSEMKYSFPFSKKIIYENNVAVINSIKDNFQRLELETPKDWSSQSMKPWILSDFNIRFYSNGDMEFTENEIDSLIEIKLKSVANNGYAPGGNPSSVDN